MKRQFKPKAPFAKLPHGDLKLYFAAFKKPDTGEIDFYKFGHTSYIDAADRFKYAPEQYSKWDVQIYKTVWGPEEDILKLELEYQERYPKTFWIEEKIGGVTEITRVTKSEVKTIITEFELLSNKYYYEREKKRMIKQKEYNLYG